ncbi:outer membrane protein assembly factor BamB family protein [Thermomonas brevis]
MCDALSECGRVARRIFKKLKLDPAQGLFDGAEVYSKRGNSVRLLSVCTLACVFVLSACGGGGGGGNQSGSGGSQGGTTTPPASVAITLTSPAINDSITQGDAYSAKITGTWSASNLGSGAVYLQVTDSANTFSLPAIQQAPGNNAISYSLPVVVGLAIGERSGTLTVRACKDASCSSVYSGASGSVAYHLLVASAPDWETQQGNAAHNGYVPIKLDPGKFSKAWEWTVPLMDGAEIAYSGRPVTGSGGVYNAVSNYFPDSSTLEAVAALDEETGSVRWLAALTASPSDQFTTDVAVSGGRVYFGVANAAYSFSVLDANTGGTVYTSDAMGSARSTMAPVLYGGSIFMQESFWNEGSRLVSMDGSSGNLQWGYSILQAAEGKPYLAPAVDDNYLYYHSACCIELLDRKTGGKVASISNPNADPANLESEYKPTMIGSRGNVLAMAFSPSPSKRRLSSFNIAGRTHEWTSAADYLPYPAIADGVVYAARIENKQFVLHALDEATGQVLWIWSPQAVDAHATSGGNVIVTRNLVFFSSYDSSTKSGKTWAVDLATHQSAWSYPRSGWLAISAKRMLYMSPYDEGSVDRIIAFRLQ